MLLNNTILKVGSIKLPTFILYRLRFFCLF